MPFACSRPQTDRSETCTPAGQRARKPLALLKIGPAALAVTLVLAIIRPGAFPKLNEVECYNMYRGLTGLGILPILLIKSLDSNGNSTQLRKKLLACPPYFASKPLLHDRTAESLVW